MKTVIAISSMISFVTLAYSQLVTPEVKRAIWNTGAETKVLFRVMDDLGHPISNVHINVGLWMPWNENAEVGVVSDDNGEACIVGKSSGEVTGMFSKNGYYSSRLHYFLYRLPGGGVKDGRWLPYGGTNIVTMKRIRQPIEMSVGYPRRISDLVFPVTNQVVGFDLKMWDWCNPYGEGRKDDCQIVYYGVEEGRLDMMFTNGLDGAVVYPRSSISVFPSIYNADTNANYKKSFTFRCTEVGENLNLSSEYIVFRVRTRVNDNGCLEYANYGKIYGPLSFRRRLSFTSYFNPTPNDTNLECDTRRNLLKDKRGRPLSIGDP